MVPQDSFSYWACAQSCIIAVNMSTSRYFDVTVLIKLFSWVFFKSMRTGGLIMAAMSGTVKWLLLSVRVLACSEEKVKQPQKHDYHHLLGFLHLLIFSLELFSWKFPCQVRFLFTVKRSRDKRFLFFWIFYFLFFFKYGCPDRGLWGRFWSAIKRDCGFDHVHVQVNI